MGEPVIDTEILHEQFDGDMELFAEVAAVFVQDCPRRLEEARQALASRDAEKLSRSAHSIKGAASTLAASACQQAAQKLELLGRGSMFELASPALMELEREVERLLQALEELS